MKWMLVVMVFGGAPVKTDLIFETLGACLKAEENMRAEYANAFDVWNEWARKNPTESGYSTARPGMMKRFGLENAGTCIPHNSR
jgi:hypothetical protein